MKKELDDKWLDELHDTMADYQADIPADGWEKLASALSSVKEPDLQKKNSKRRIIPMWLRSAVAATLLLIAGFSTYKYLPTYKTKEQPTLEKYFVEIPEKPVVPNKPTAEPIKRKETNSRSEKTKKIKEVFVPTENENKVMPVETTDKPKETTNKPEEAVNETPPEKIPVTEQEQPIERLEVDNKLLTMADPVPTKKQKKHRKKSESNGWSLGMRIGGNSNINLSPGGFDDDIENLNSGTFSDPFGSNGFFTNNGFGKDSTIVQTRGASSFGEQKSLTRADETMRNGKEELKVTDSDNHRAWSAGISVQKQLTEHLAIESGLVYTLLTSNVTMYSSYNNNCNGTYKSLGEYTQKLHYLGVPLKLNAKFYDRNGWQIYCNGGVMLERCVAATRNGKSFTDNDWQWSVRGGAGMQYKISQYLGIYVEPGVAYYIENYSKIPSLYTEHPFNFSLNAGLRLIL